LAESGIRLPSGEMSIAAPAGVLGSMLDGRSLWRGATTAIHTPQGRGDGGLYHLRYSINATNATVFLLRTQRKWKEYSITQRLPALKAVAFHETGQRHVVDSENPSDRAMGDELLQAFLADRLFAG